MSDTPETNNQLVLISGKSGTGKSAALRNIRNQANWGYLITEAGKRAPFQNKFQSFRITDPYEVWEAFDHFMDPAQNSEGLIVDSLTFLMDMFESIYVTGAKDGQKAWGDFAQFFKTLMQAKVPAYQHPVIITAHTLDKLNEQAMEMETAVPIKGSLKNNGVEAYFSTVVATKKLTLKDLAPYANPMLIITEDDEMLGYKHVFQTRPTKTTTGERIRSPMGLFSREQTFMDNDAQLLLDHLKAFYG